MKKIVEIFVLVLFFYLIVPFYEGNFIFAETISNDTNFMERTGIKELHEQGFKGEGIKIAVLDSGTIKHDEYVIAGGENFVPNANGGIIADDYILDDTGHGTSVFGLIAGKSTGVAPNAEVYSLKVTDNNHYDTEAIKNAIQWCINNKIDIINVSFGALDIGKIDDIVVFFQDLKSIFQVASDNGIIIVAAAGNEGTNTNYLEDTVTFPSKYENIIAVSNVDNLDKITQSSSKGPEIDIAAPGNYVYTTSKEPTKYAYEGGTSFSSPIVAGTLALLKQKYPELSPEKLTEMLKYLAQTRYKKEGNLGNEVTDSALGLKKNDFYGYGLLTAEVGTKKPGKITIPSEYYQPLGVYAFPNERFARGGGFETGKEYTVLRTFDDTKNNMWFEVEMIREGHKIIRWMKIEMEDYNKKITLNKRTNLYKDFNDSVADDNINPQTVNGIKKVKGVNWFLINTWKGPRWIKPTDFSEGDFNLTTVNRETLYTKNTDGTFSSTIDTLAPQTVTGLFREGDWFQINTWQGPRWIKPKSYFIGKFSVTVPKKVKLYTKKNDLNSVYMEYDMATFEVAKREDSWFQTTNGYWFNPSEYYLGVFQIKLLESKNIYNPTIYGTEYLGSLAPQTVFAYGAYIHQVGSSYPKYPCFQINTWLGKVYIFGDADADSIKGVQLIEYDDNLIK
ncbi:S8 family peptidase [Bacillus thuringiensis]|uniref:S8 family peptidase n=1 Tax=Bacillus thuringiensis TaxID=1428 RepID=UPI0021D671F1|nr:S8 family serine peptidase [Bacillus thuringiensis]MCU7667750.1 S8 family serine peptidase [Bacillus thuringiensis]